MNGKIHFKDADVYLAWNGGKPLKSVSSMAPGKKSKAKALCGNTMNNNTTNFFGYDPLNMQIRQPNKVTCKRCIAEMKKLGL